MSKKTIIEPFIMILLFIFPVIALSAEDAIVLDIGVPMDNKPDSVFGHTVIRYIVRQSGDAHSVRHVRSWADQQAQFMHLSKGALEKVQAAIAALPDGKVDLPRDQTLFVVDRKADPDRRLVFDRRRLPSHLKDVIDLLGGVRPELEGKLEFNLDQAGTSSVLAGKDAVMSTATGSVDVVLRLAVGHTPTGSVYTNIVWNLSYSNSATAQAAIGRTIGETIIIPPMRILVIKRGADTVRYHLPLSTDITLRPGDALTISDLMEPTDAPPFMSGSQE